MTLFLPVTFFGGLILSYLPIVVRYLVLLKEITWARYWSIYSTARDYTGMRTNIRKCRALRLAKIDTCSWRYQRRHGLDSKHGRVFALGVWKEHVFEGRIRWFLELESKFCPNRWEGSSRQRINACLVHLPSRITARPSWQSQRLIGQVTHWPNICQVPWISCQIRRNAIGKFG